MNYSEALESLKAARPAVERIKYTRVSWNTSPQEYATFDEIDRLLQQFFYSKDLLRQAGWNKLDLAFFHTRLGYYRKHIPATLVLK
jgi:hypothetical protein